MGVMLVSCRQRLKYIIKEIHVIVSIPATTARQGGRWQPTLWICVNFEPQRTRSAQSVFSFLDNLVDKKMKISDRIDRIRSNPVNPVKRYD
ncbi:MAG: hypothetical protein GQ533_05895 [Methanosarcinaceae archaeon]|nr:hypothetical protein [Methanosarcinaceae archaeon]